ncbi:MAG: hypothetical protein FWD79_11755 [Desulfobulbus sp.]|nr:hypothetical protein [Desulfobulbus sp.]
MPCHNQNLRAEITALFARAGISPGTMVRIASLASGAGTARATVEGAGGFRWILTTEQAATVWDWDRYDFVDEVLLADGILQPEIRQVPLLDSHSRFSVDDHLGSVTDIKLDQAGGYAAISGLVRFAADDKSQRTRQKVEDGHLTDGSVGYRVTKSIWIPKDTEAVVKGRLYTGPLKVSHESQLKEFSITPIGADTLAKVKSLCAWGRLA